MLTEEQIKEFQNLYKQKFGKDIGKKEALEKGFKLIKLLEIIIYRSMNKDDDQES